MTFIGKLTTEANKNTNFLALCGRLTHLVEEMSWKIQSFQILNLCLDTLASDRISAQTPYQGGRTTWIVMLFIFKTPPVCFTSKPSFVLGWKIRIWHMRRLHYSGSLCINYIAKNCRSIVLEGKKRCCRLLFLYLFESQTWFLADLSLYNPLKAGFVSRILRSNI